MNKKIAFVCLGNICRSPIAEGVWNHLAQERGIDIVADSFGTNGYHTGEHPHRYSIKVCKEHGYDISKQVSRRFTANLIHEYDTIYVMAADVYRDIQALNIPMDKVDYFLNIAYPGQNLDVVDPWYGDEDGYLPVFQQIESVCKLLMDRYISEISAT